MEPPYEVNEDSARIREVYARYGLAMYAAQLLETGLIQYAVTLQRDGFNINSPEDYEATWDKLAKMTLGQLLKAIDPTLLNDEIKAEFDNALALRNRLTHRYFWEKANEMLGKSSKEQMVIELQGYADYFKELDAKITQNVHDWAQAQGILLDELNEIEMKKLRAKAL